VTFPGIPLDPKTSVGKFDKKMLCARDAEGGLEVIETSA
jgi:hypothetical protein